MEVRERLQLTAATTDLHLQSGVVVPQDNYPYRGVLRRAELPDAVAGDQLPELGDPLVPDRRPLAAGDAREQVLDQGGELHRVERLRQIGDPARLEAALAVAEVGARGQED